MAPPTFCLKVRGSKRIALQNRTRPLPVQATDHQSQSKQQPPPNPQQKSRRQLYKERDETKYKELLECERRRSQLYRLEMTEAERLQRNRLAAVRQRRYRERQKEAKEEREKKEIKTRIKNGNRRITRSEQDRIALKRKKDAERKRIRRQNQTQEQREENNKKRRDAYGAKVVKERQEQQNSLENEMRKHLEEEIEARLEQERQEKLQNDIEERLEKERQERLEKEIKERLEKEIKERLEKEIKERLEKEMQERLENEVKKRLAKEGLEAGENDGQGHQPGNKIECDMSRHTPVACITPLPVGTYPTESILPSQSSSAKRKRLSRIKRKLDLPQNAEHYAELVADLCNSKSPRKITALSRRGLGLQSEDKRQRLGKNICDIVAREVKTKNKKFGRALHILKHARLQRFASKTLGINRKVMVANARKSAGRKPLKRSTITKIHTFYESMAQPLPEKKLVSKKTNKPRMILSRPIQHLHELFKQTNPGVRCSKTQFFDHRPNHVKSFKQSKYIGCLCEYCENIKLKIAALDTHLEVGGLSTVKLGETRKAMSITLCAKDEGKDFHKIQCIKRKCKDCGVDKLKKHLSGITPTMQNHQTTWKKWDITKREITQNGKTIHVSRKGLVVKQGTVVELVEELLKEVEPHALHLFNWWWQARQYTALKKDLPPTWVLSVWDFAENFTCFYQDEVQSCYWTRNQATLHPVVTYYQCPDCTSQITESIVFISQDTKHDYDAVHTFMNLVAVHLQQKRGIKINMMVRFSDGCASQYKSRGPIADIAKAQKNYSFQLCHNYFGSRHGKGPADGEAAVIKSHATNAIKSGTSVIGDARAFYEHCVENLQREPIQDSCLHFRRAFYFVESITRGRPENLIKTVPGTRTMHSILATKKQDMVKKRSLSCFCASCKEGSQGCKNLEFVEDWHTIPLKRLDCITGSSNHEGSGDEEFAAEDDSSGTDAATPAANTSSGTDAAAAAANTSSGTDAATPAANTSSRTDAAAAANTSSETDAAAAANTSSETDAAAAANTSSETDAAAAANTSSDTEVQQKPTVCNDGDYVALVLSRKKPRGKNKNLSIVYIACIKYKVHLDDTPGDRREQRSASHPLRIHVEYEDDVDALPAAMSLLVKNDLLPEAVRSLSRMLNVRSSLTGAVRLNRACAFSHYYTLANDSHEYCVGSCNNVTRCGPVTIPNKHLHACYTCDEKRNNCHKSGGKTGPGVRDTDFILYVTAENTFDCQIADTTAHASFCQMEATQDRPIAGYINLCPSALSTDPTQRTMQLTTVQHEIIHSLGFTAALYAFYRDSNGEPFTQRDASGLPPFNESLGLYQWGDRVIKQIKRRDWDVRGGRISHTVNVMVMPNVAREARNHFDCPLLEGMEVENNGGYGTKLTHFEKRLLENEAMTGTHTHERVFSRLTLAVLEDTGWYLPNYDMADPLDWGKGLGCDFVTRSCKYWMDTRHESQESLSPFCDIIRAEPFTLTCSVGRASVALCNLHRYEEKLAPHYQYFDSLPGVSDEDLARYGGTSELADYCPFQQQFNYKEPNGSKKSTTCKISSNTPSVGENVAAEYYGTLSTCVEHAESWQQWQCNHYQAQQTWGAGCYQYSCGTDGLKIIVEGVNHLCSWKGQQIDVSVTSEAYLHTGKIICPSCQELCGNLCPTTSVPGVTLELSVREPGDEGECPRFPPDLVSPCVDECKSNAYCGRREKCCNFGCGHKCQRRVIKTSTTEPCPNQATVARLSMFTQLASLLILSFMIFQILS